MPRKSTKVVDYEVSSGNVYADLGFADSAEMLAKARIVAQIGRIIQAHKLTQAEAGLSKLDAELAEATSGVAQIDSGLVQIASGLATGASTRSTSVLSTERTSSALMFFS